MAYGRGFTRFDENKRAIDDKYMGPVIKTAMTRCIQCTRCVRFAEEVAGVPELGMLYRGEDAQITSYLERAVTEKYMGPVVKTIMTRCIHCTRCIRFVEQVAGVEVEVPKSFTMLQACEAAGAEIPRFCYHERLSIAGNCRMCLVDWIGAPFSSTRHMRQLPAIDRRS